MAELKPGCLVRWTHHGVWQTHDGHEIQVNETALVREGTNRYSWKMLHWDGTTSQWGSPLSYWEVVEGASD